MPRLEDMTEDERGRKPTDFCHNCLFWKQITVPDVFGRVSHEGECREDSPAYDWEQRRVDGRPVAYWPVTGEAAWCGKHVLAARDGGRGDD